MEQNNLTSIPKGGRMQSKFGSTKAFLFILYSLGLISKKMQVDLMWEVVGRYSNSGKGRLGVGVAPPPLLPTSDPTKSST